MSMYKEIEFKYRADNISLQEFANFCKGHGQCRHLSASGYDYFYEPKNSTGAFCRYRSGPDSNQLTFKRKLSTGNNYIRTEHNIDLAPGVTQEQVAALCEEFGYSYSFSIFKNAFIYIYDQFIFVYYVVYDINMKELGRFIEIEMSESYPWQSEDEAWEELTHLEGKLGAALGITPQARLKTSLFERFKETAK